METKINIAAILKDKPQGTKLYSSACGKCRLVEVDDKSFKISFYNSKFGFMNGGEGYLDKNGKLYDDGECVVFPSKEMRDWGKFSWKKGDVLVNKDGDVHIIFERFVDDTYCSFVGKYYLWKENNDTEHFYKNERLLTSDFQKAGKDAAQTYISAIEERLGGKLNLQTLEIEKQLEFKDGDILLYKSAKFTFFSSIFILNSNRNEMSSYVRFSIGKGSIDYDVPVCCNLYTDRFRYATEEEKQQLFDALAKEGKAWNAEKKQIVDLKPKWTPKPFDKVITRNAADDVWTANIFSHMDSHGEYVTIACVGGYTYCLPYNEKTAKLIGTTNNVEG